jgi:hypothetical protein
LALAVRESRTAIWRWQYVVLTDVVLFRPNTVTYNHLIEGYDDDDDDDDKMMMMMMMMIK